MIILYYFPLTILFVPSNICYTQDNQNNPNRKMGK